MSTKPEIKLLRSDNRIVVSPTTPEVRDLLAQQLCYVEKIFHRGADARGRRNMGLSVVEEVLWQCYADDHKNRMATSFGFVPRIRRVLTEAGYPVKLYWATQAEADEYKIGGSKVDVVSDSDDAKSNVFLVGVEVGI